MNINCQPSPRLAAASGSPAPSNLILLEDGTALLLEDGTNLLLE